MKRILLLLPVVGLLSCTSPSSKDENEKAPPQRSVSGLRDEEPKNLTIEQKEAAALAAANEVCDDAIRKGPPAGFVYRYNAKITELAAMYANSEHRKFASCLSQRRADMLDLNLFDTGVDPDSTADNCADVMQVKHRTANGQCYFHGLRTHKGNTENKTGTGNINHMRMGDNNQRFGRNVNPDKVKAVLDPQTLLEPNPREISRRLFTRENGKTREADIINVLAAAWLQAQNHDWFTHGKNDKSKEIEVVKPNSGDRAFPDGMNIPVTAADTSSIDRQGYPVTFRNRNTHWWDASHIYGSDQATIDRVRTIPDAAGANAGRRYDEFPETKGHIAVDMNKRQLYYDKTTKLPITGFTDNWWLGLELIHSLFAMEHNRVATALANSKEGRNLSAEEIFQKSRLIVAGLIAKIHTVDWTPALLDNKALHIAMHVNWYGLKAALGIDAIPSFARILRHLNLKRKQIISGLVGPEDTLDLYNVPFTLTEEFVAVYRMHPLIPEKVYARDLKWNPYKGGRASDSKDGVKVENTIFKNVPTLVDTSLGGRPTLHWMLGLGTTHPGGLVLHNYPSFMQKIRAERNAGVEDTAENAVEMDIGAVDILRDRERGVPRYNEFRRALRLKPLEKFEDLFASPLSAADAKDVKILKEIYGDKPEDVEKLDLIVGSLGESDRYAGYAFGNTPFHIFLLMASRRLMTDPFFSDYYIPEVYTQFGLDWIENESMASVIVRHYPELKDSLKGVSSAFRPWKPVYDEVKKKYSKTGAH